MRTLERQGLSPAERFRFAAAIGDSAIVRRVTVWWPDESERERHLDDAQRFIDELETTAPDVWRMVLRRRGSQRLVAELARLGSALAVRTAPTKAGERASIICWGVTPSGILRHPLFLGWAYRQSSSPRRVIAAPQAEVNHTDHSQRPNLFHVAFQLATAGMLPSERVQVGQEGYARTCIGRG